MFPIKSKTSTYCTKITKITNSEFGSTAGALAGLGAIKIAQVIVTKGGAAQGIIAGTFANNIINNYGNNSGYTGIQLSVNYYYGHDNHGTIGWTPGAFTLIRYK